MTINIKKYSVVPILLVFSSVPPVVLYLVPGLQLAMKAMLLISLMIMLGTIFFFPKISDFQKPFLIILLFQFLYFLILGLLTHSSSYLTLCVKLTFAIIIFSYIHIIEDGIRKFTGLFLRIIAVLGIIGVAIFFLVLVGKLEAISTFRGADNRIVYNFFLSFSNAYLKFGDFRIVRVSSFFDEPGQLGLILTFALLLNYITEKNRILEKFFIITGLITLSLAFIISLTLYFVFLKIEYKKPLKSLNYLVPIIIVLLLLTILKNRNSKAEMIYDLTIGRVENGIVNGFVKGDNRELSVKMGKKIIKDNNLIFGLGLEKLEQKYPEYDRSSIFGAIIIYGYFGTLILYFSFILYFLLLALNYNINNRALIINIVPIKIFLILLINIFQRPFLNRSLYIILFYLLVVALLKNKFRNQYA